VCQLASPVPAKGKDIIVMSYHPKHVTTVPKALWALNNYFNCQYRIPVFIYYDHLNAENVAVLQQISLNASSCSNITLINVDKEFELPPNVNRTVMQLHINNTLPMPQSYRSMCRFWSGLFYQHPSLLPYDYYWRLDTDGYLISPTTFNPFDVMRRENLLYATRILMGESDLAVVGLREAMDEYFQKLGVPRPPSVADKTSIYYTNFEFGKLDWFRSPVYQNLFAHLDSKAGFHHKRWGDAPVHTYAVDTLIPTGQMRYFDEIGYQHGMRFEAGFAWIMWDRSCDPELRHHHSWCTTGKPPGADEAAARANPPWNPPATAPIATPSPTPTNANAKPKATKLKTKKVKKVRTKSSKTKAKSKPAKARAKKQKGKPAARRKHAKTKKAAQRKSTNKQKQKAKVTTKTTKTKLTKGARTPNQKDEL